MQRFFGREFPRGRKGKVDSGCSTVWSNWMNQWIIDWQRRLRIIVHWLPVQLHFQHHFRGLRFNA